MKVKNLLKTKANWTRGEFARDKYGHPVNIKSTSACRWCLGGAIIKCYPCWKQQKDVYTKIDNYLFKKFNNVRQIGIIAFNDSYATFEDVKTLVKELDI